MSTSDSPPDPDPLADPVAHPSEDPMIGQLIASRYRLVRRLGEGGMGVVYLAQHVELDKLVAVKVLADRLTLTTALVENLQREARTAARIRHENIVDITDLGRTSSGLVFVVMEYLEGRSLFDAIYDGGPMSIERTRHIAMQLFSAVEAAHDHDVIHRDLKPENVFLIARDHAADFVKLLDFGVATVRAQGEKRLSIDGRSAGTPLYMSPEHLRGEAPDRGFDVFALACILYEMLTGVVPFDGESAGAILTRQLAGPPTPPSQQPGATPTPPEIDAVLARALSLNRVDRYPTVAALREAFLAALDGEPAPAQPPPIGALAATRPQTRAPQTTSLVERPLPPRRRLGLAVLGATVFGAALALTWMTVRWRARSAAEHEAAAAALRRQEVTARALALCAEGERALTGRDYARALSQFDSADALETGTRCDASTRAAAVRGRAAIAAGMVAVDDFFIDRYEFPNEKGRRPLTGVDWHEAVVRCEQAGKKLCTEQQWQAACAGPTESAYPYGAAHRDACFDERPRETAPRASGAQAACVTAAGVADLSGNVAEWTATPLTPGAPQRVVRGGWWGTDRSQTTCQARDYLMPGNGGSRSIGFRCCN